MGAAAAHKDEGNRRWQSGDLAGARAAYEAALAADPHYVPALNNLALLCKQAGDYEPAEACLRAALAVTPEDAELHNNLAVLLHETGRLETALASYQAALATNPADAFAQGNCGALLSQLGQGEAAIPYCRRAVELAPDSADLRLSLGKVLRDVGQMDAALPELARAAKTPGAGIEHLSAWLFALLYPPEHAGGVEWPAYRDFDREHVQPRLAQRFRHVRAPASGRRLRLGYVSGALRGHVTYFFIAGVLAQHDHGRFEVFLYDTAAAKDDKTAVLARYADHYVDCRGRADRTLAERIYADRLDVLIDLDGHIGFNAQLALAWKPAPVQVSWLGFPHSTGSGAIDYWLSDGHIAAAGFPEPRSEKIECMPDFYMVFAAGDAPPVTPLPALTNGYVTFGSFNAPNKLNDAVLRAWARVLLRVPNARLLMASMPGPAFEARVAAVMAAAGWPASRTRFVRACDHPRFLALHGEVDVALDPFPINGTTTSLFGLWMGVPFLSVEGISHRARVGLSLLRTLGLDRECLVDDPDRLPDCAAALTADLTALARLRAGLRERMAASPLCDAPRFTRALEARVAAMQARWAAPPPAPSAVF